MNGREALRQILRPPIITRSLIVAVVVGTLLNLINQGDAFLGGAEINWGKIALTFVVPLLVASYGSWSALAQRTDRP